MKNVLFAGMIGLMTLCLTSQAQADSSKITVSGLGVEKIRATEAKISLAVQKESKTAKEVNNQLAKTASPVLDVLRRQRVDNLETGSANIYPLYSKDDSQRVIGYRGQQTITFTTPVEQAGSLIDSSIQAGANRLQSIYVQPTDEAVQKGREQALIKAVHVGLQEADTVLKALGQKRGNITKIQIVPEGGPVAFRSMMSRDSLAFAEKSTLEVTEEEHEVKATVSLEIDY